MLRRPVPRVRLPSGARHPGIHYLLVGRCLRDKMEGQSQVPHFKTRPGRLSSHYRKQDFENFEDQTDQLVASAKWSSTTSIINTQDPRANWTPTISFTITMSYPEDQKAAQSSTQVCLTLALKPGLVLITFKSNGAGSANQATPTPSSPALERYLAQKPWEDPFYVAGTQSNSSSSGSNNGTSTGSGASK